MSKKLDRSTLTLEDFFRIPIFLYRALGFDFERKPYYAKFYKFFYVLLVLELGAHAFMRYFMTKELVQSFNKGELIRPLQLAPYFCFATDSNVKALAFVLNLKTLRKIYEQLRQEFPANDAESQRDYCVQQHDLPKLVRRSIVLYFFSVWSFFLISPVITSFSAMFLAGNAAAFPYQKPLPIVFNFNYRKPLTYSFIYMLEVLNVHFTCLMHAGTDVWLICFVSQICMHLDYINRKLENYLPHELNSKQDCKFLHGLIRKHQLMHDLHMKINSVFGISLIINVLTSMSVVCLVGVHITVMGIGMEFLKYVTFISGYIIQFYFVCSYGQKIKTMSENIAVGAYTQCWYNGSQRYKREIQFIIRRSQKPMELSGYGFHPITLDTFKLVMRMSYQVFALVQTMLDHSKY